MQPAEWKSIREAGARIERWCIDIKSCRVVSRACARSLSLSLSLSLSPPLSISLASPSPCFSLLSSTMPSFSRSNHCLSVNMSVAIWIWIIRNFLYLISSYISHVRVSDHGPMMCRIEFPSRDSFQRDHGYLLLLNRPLHTHEAHERKLWRESLIWRIDISARGRRVRNSLHLENHVFIRRIW